MFKTLDPKTLDKATGGVRPGPNGEGCTGPFPRPGQPRPRPLGGLGNPAEHA